MAKNYVRENVPLSRFGVLVAQLESIVASATQQSPDPILCFDLLSDLISAIDEEPKDSILLWQRKCEDALYSLLVIGARRPVRHLASIAMARIISKGDGISIYSRASSLQGFLSDGKRSEPQRVSGAAQCLGKLYQHFGRRITSGLPETAVIATKLFKFHEEFVRQEALNMLQNALEGSGGGAAASAYSEAFRLIMRSAVGDKSFAVRIAAARCLKAFANIGGPGLGVAELDNSASYCVKALEDTTSSVRDAFAEALGSLLALGMNPEAQVQPRGKGPFPPAKKLEGGLQRHLALPFTKASGIRSRDMRVGLALSWVFFLQALHLKYLHPDSELQNFALHVMDMLRADPSVDAHALACVLYILHVGVTDQMTEPTQRSFLVFLGKQLQSLEASPSMKIAALRTLSYTLKQLGEVPLEFKEVLDNTVVPAISDSSELVRAEAALTLRALAEVDPTCVGGLTSYGVTILNALRENVSFEKGSNLQFELDSLHGQATVLAALVSISPKLPLGYPARLPRSVLEVSRKMLMDPSRNPVVAVVENKAGWLLLSSLLASLPKEELEDQVFDILSLWATLFSGNPEDEVKETADLTSRLDVWSATVDALTAFIRCFISPDVVKNGVLLQPVLLYLSRALSYISAIIAKELPNTNPAVDIFIIRTLIAYQSLHDPMLYKSDHPQIIQLCTTPFRYASGCEDSSCLRQLLDKRDALLGPWNPGRDWFEDELRAFQGGKDGLVPSVWENELSSFPQPETISKTLVNQKLICFGVMFACQDNSSMLSLLGIIEQCLKTGRKQQWHAASVTNICVGLLAGFKALLSLRPQPLGQEVLGLAQSIFQSILAEGGICASQRRASSEGLGYLARLGNDFFTARMTRLLLGDLNGATDSSYAGSIAFALGCIHRSAGGMALSTLVPATVSYISSLAKSSIANLQIWALHGLLLTIEAAGLSFVSHVQATLGLAMDILLSDESGLVDLQQGVGRLINAIVAVLGPELSPGSIFFSRCKSVVAEISFWQETATMLESARFTQQLVLFAPQAVSVHLHLQTLLPTLSSRQPTLRHLAVSTLRHLIEKDPASIIDEQIEDILFHMLDEETDSEIGNLVRTTIMRLLYVSCRSCPSHWISVCRKVVLATSARRNSETNNNASNDNPDTDSNLNFGDDENMVSSSKGMPGYAFDALSVLSNRDKHLRYRTRIFAAECLSHLPKAVGRDPGHFDLSLARKQPGDWLVLHLQELISLAYQISTIQFENMQPIGVGLLGSIVDKFENVPDPELPGHLLLEQYQAQLVSAVRTTLDALSSPSLLEAGLHLATKILTSGIISGDQAVVKRIFSLISRPLNDFEDLYFPSFAEWVSSKIKIRLLAAHASLKCYIYAFLRRHHKGVPDEYLALLPLFSKSSSILGKYWIRTLKDYTYVCMHFRPKKNGNLFLDGLQSPLVSSKLQPCLEESWPVILQALALDAVPVNLGGGELSKAIVDDIARNGSASGYSMVVLELEEFQFLWGFSLLVLFESQHPTLCKPVIPLASAKAKYGEDSPNNKMNPSGLKLYEIVLPVFQFLSTERFFGVGFLTMDTCRELLQILLYNTYTDNSWNGLAISVLSQVVRNFPKEFLHTDNFAYLATEVCLAYLFRVFQSADAVSSERTNWENVISTLCSTSKTLVNHVETKMQGQLKSVVIAFLLAGYKFIREALTELCVSEVTDLVNCASSLLKIMINDASELDGILHLRKTLGTCLSMVVALVNDFIEGFHLLESKKSNPFKLLQLKLAFSLEHIMAVSKLALDVLCLEDNKDNDSIFYSTLINCTRCIRTVLTDSNVHVQTIGLQVLKTMVQKGTNDEDNSFVMFLAGELIYDVFTIIQDMLKIPITKESLTVAIECLKLMVLLHTASRVSNSQRGYMVLLLEAIIMVFFSTEDGFSREVNELRSTAVRLVSHLAQIPSSAVHFKDVLLSMPPVHRQQLQGVIRSSVTQDNSAMHAKTEGPLLEVKIPVPAGGSYEKFSVHLATPVQTEKTIMEDQEEEDEEEEDDWDAFQSFPASANATGMDSKTESAAGDPSHRENSSDTEITTGSDQFQECSTSKPLDSVKHLNHDSCQEEVEEEKLSDESGIQMSPQNHEFDTENMEKHDLQTNYNANKPKPCEDEHQEREEEVTPVPGTEKEEASSKANEQFPSDHHSAEGSLEMNSVEDREQRKQREEELVPGTEKGATSHEGNQQAPSDDQPAEDAEGLLEMNLVEDQEQKEMRPNIDIDQIVTDPLALEGSSHEPHGDIDSKVSKEQHKESDEGASKKASSD